MNISNNSISIDTINIFGDKVNLQQEVQSVKNEIQSELNSLFSELLDAQTVSSDSAKTTTNEVDETIDTKTSTNEENAASSINIGTINIYLNDILEELSNETTSNTDSVAIQKTDFSTLPFNVPSEYQSIIDEMASKYNVDGRVIASVIFAESSFKSSALSSSGAEGLMQLMPDTAKDLGVNNSFDVYQNIEGGTKYLSQMLTKYNGDLSLSLAAYNAGPGNVDRYKGIPPFKETENYVKKITGFLA